ncbi:hypothetical protein JD844_031623 [Phrynosoma platyrhinos]|uniref:Uncharacterized protein n=1 Tax=Phrynosoma platyrhinos TaxID=52577 RepID=A0ABQ7T197_PHRPL|nr:hypothetical protein JD844_031623 [Phrynosoma platyrhinos]
MSSLSYDSKLNGYKTSILRSSTYVSNVDNLAHFRFYSCPFCLLEDSIQCEFCHPKDLEIDHIWHAAFELC